jgi:hypothetical protein
MVEPFSEETLELFERAEQAIRISVELRRVIAAQLDDANRWLKSQVRLQAETRAASVGDGRERRHGSRGKVGR